MLKNIGIIGAGYVGLTTAISFTKKGFKVILCDNNEEIVNEIKNGKSHFYEPKLHSYLSESLEKRLLESTTSINILHENCDIIFICVGTPSKDDGNIDLSQVENVCKELARLIKNSQKRVTIVIKSTVVPATTDTYVLNILENLSGKKLGEFGLGMNPEFLREGSAVNDALNPDRLVIGYEDKATKDELSILYESWTCKKIFVNSRTAEMIKYTNNSLLALLISTANELSNLSRQIGGISFLDVLEGVKYDRRWNMSDNISIFPDILNYLKPGPGFGGSCFPKDVKALLSFGKNLELDMPILDSIVNVNQNQHLEIIKILSKRSLLNKKNKLMVLGLSFKEDTDDIRNSKSIDLINSIHGKIDLYAHDPFAISNTKTELRSLKDIEYVDDWESTIYDMDVVIIMTNWNQYKNIRPDNMISTKLIIDSRGFLYSRDYVELDNYINL